MPVLVSSIRLGGNEMNPPGMVAAAALAGAAIMMVAASKKLVTSEMADLIIGVYPRWLTVVDLTRSILPPMTVNPASKAKHTPGDSP